MAREYSWLPGREDRVELQVPRRVAKSRWRDTGHGQHGAGSARPDGRLQTGCMCALHLLSAFACSTIHMIIVPPFWSRSATRNGQPFRKRRGGRRPEEPRCMRHERTRAARFTDRKGKSVDFRTLLDFAAGRSHARSCIPALEPFFGRVSTWMAPIHDSASSHAGQRGHLGFV